jgi:hypothetical protein
MMRDLWRVPGVVLAPGYVIWVVAVSFLVGTTGGGRESHDFAAALMIVPFFVWLAASCQELRSVGRPWWKSILAPAFLAVWLAYALLVVPFLLDEDAGIGGSGALGLIVNALFAVSLILGYDQVAFALPRAERVQGERRSGYIVTLLQLLFPPIALWVAHSRISSVLSRMRTANV